MLKERVKEFLNEQVEALRRAVGFNLAVHIGERPLADAVGVYRSRSKDVEIPWLTAYGWYRNNSITAARKTLLHEFTHYLIDIRFTDREKRLLGSGHNAVFMVVFELLAVSGLPASPVVPRSPIWFYDFCEEKILSPEESVRFLGECQKRLVKYNGTPTVRQVIFLLHALHGARLEMAA